MARRDDEPKILYTSVLPATKNPHHHYHNQQRLARKDNPIEQSRAHYVEFENAFRDDRPDDDYFGFEPRHLSNPPANLHLQSVETISEIQNRNFSSYLRYYPSRETSHSSTPSSQSPYPFQLTQRLPSEHQLNPQELSNLNLIDKLSPVKNFSEPLNSKLIPLTTKASETMNFTLPQYFLVKYLGRAACLQIWGANAVRGPIDMMVNSARQLSSTNELPTLEASISKHGLTLIHQQSPTRNKHNRHESRSPERSHHGLIPLDSISYAMHDVKYSKIASCIVLRQVKTSTTDPKHRPKTNETITECYVFLFQSREHAHRFTLALVQAFNMVKQSARPSPTNPSERKESTRPAAHRSKHRHEKQRSEHKQRDQTYSRDSYV